MARQPSIRPPTKPGNRTWLARWPTTGMIANTILSTNRMMITSSHTPNEGTNSRQASPHHDAPLPATTLRGETDASVPDLGGGFVAGGNGLAMVVSPVRAKGHFGPSGRKP